MQCMVITSTLVLRVCIGEGEQGQDAHPMITQLFPECTEKVSVSVFTMWGGAILFCVYPCRRTYNINIVATAFRKQFSLMFPSPVMTNSACWCDSSVLERITFKLFQKQGGVQVAITRNY